MNVVTGIMLVAVLIGVVHGYRLGLGWVVLPSAGFVLGFLLGVRLAPLAMGFVEHPVAKLATAVVVTIILISLGAGLGRFVARRFDKASDRLHLGWVNRSLGAGLQAAIVLVLAWLLASGASSVDAFGLGRQVQTSPVIRALNEVLPAPPDIVSRLRGIISPNGFPNVFLAGEPRSAVITPGQSVDPAVIASASGSVVQVIGVGCGGLVEGSGFVVSPGVVVTNAHVVAGVGELTVSDGAGRHAAATVLFDPDEDLAVLTAPTLQAAALPTDSTDLTPGATGAVLGYPGGGPLRADGSVVLERTTAVGQNIYDQGSVSRSIYVLAANIEHGSSGGPLLTSEGAVAGVVFAKSVTQDEVGYALVWSEVAADVSAASQRTEAVTTGACAAR
jgi:S1-C subfamily serine protease